jgi:ATP-dependent protease Clp ATPase subunit
MTSAPLPPKPHPERYCSFCGQSEFQVAVLVSSPMPKRAFICDSCANQAVAAIAEQKRKEQLAV